jgi:hypothetical protein
VSRSWLRHLLRWLAIALAIAGGVVVLSFIALIISLRRPPFETALPAYQQVSKIVEGRANSEHEVEIDFASVNDGNWTILCITGGYGHPLEVLQRAAATEPGTKVNIQSALQEKWSDGMAVEEFEGSVAFAAGDGAVTVFRHPAFGHELYQHGNQCTTRARPVMAVFVAGK